MALRILVADSDVKLGALLSKSLGSAGHEVTVVSDAAGVKSALGRGGRADVIVLDPDIVGNRVESVLERRAQARVFICSSRSRDDQRVKLVSAAIGDAEFLRKPYSILELESRLGDIAVDLKSKEAPVKTQRRVSARPEPTLNRARVTKEARQVQRASTAVEDSGLLRRLQREWRELHEASPRDVLGLPAGVEMKMVDASARRMKDRYSNLARDANNSPEIRRLALNLEELVERSWKNFKSVEPRTVRTEPRPEPQTQPVLSEEQELLALGQRLIKAGSWAEADRALTKANQLDLADPIILACLGWARLNNPEMEEQDRIDEGVEFMILGEQFGPKEIQGLIYLVKGLEIQGRLDAAFDRASRVRKLDPDNAEIQHLYRRLRMAQSPG